MKITLNNREETIEKDSLTIAELIKLKNYTFKMIVTKVNDKLVKKDDRETTVICDGDKVTVLHLVSGG